ncbi:RNA polymerase sigma factor [Streptomyces sp. NBC_00287]|uniref:RNA polymerase sigma factor n=1 Tax=Streptomyces sp. NBC_00287 TaxID=2975702 RepID=UPI002E29751D|nr:RNA polymerase sigma factor [Streptomyces sp. NBC_00287]
MSSGSDVGERHGVPYDTGGLAAAVADARRGSEDAFRTLYRALYSPLLGYLTARLGRDEATAAATAVWQEIAQGVFSFHGDGTDFRVWVMSLARRQVEDHPQQVRPAGTDTDDLRRALTALPSDLSEALLLREVVRLDDAAAARVLGTTAVSARAAADRAAWLVADCLASRPEPGGPRTELACAWC